jgi:hypothetical protein
MKRIWKPLVAVVVFVAVATGAGAAYGFWSTTGTGSGVATTGDMDPVTITSATAGDVVGSSLRPGGTADVVLKVHNPNAFAVHVVNILQVEGADITAHDGSGTCDTTGVTYTAPTTVADIPMGDSTIILPDAAAMDLTSDNGCQGATFEIPVTLTVKA